MFDFVDPYIIGLVVVVIALDIISGLWAAFVNNEYSSKVFRQGLYHKTAYFFIVALAIFCGVAGQHLEIGEPYTTALLPAVSALIVLGEITSVLENVVKIFPELGESAVLSAFKAKE